MDDSKEVKPGRTYSNEEALDMAIRISLRIKRDALAGNDYAIRVLKEEVFDKQ